MFRKILIAVITLSIIKVNAAAHSTTERTDYQVLINDAITQFEKTPREQWSYQVARYENEEGYITTSLEQFNANSKTWHLLKTNEKIPSEAQQKAFLQKKEKQKEGVNISIQLRELINQESLSFQNEDNDYLYLNFDVNLKKLGKKASNQLVGKLSYNKGSKYIELIEIENTAPFSPIFSAKITDFNIQLAFIKRDISILPKHNTMTMKGTFAFFTKIEEQSTDTFSDYQRLQP
ncbi:hypothetical protein [Pseudoalteromonas sp.]|uniref:hypothetical protein n=1 Tax=Pseudoalteromonas sp. TaxID=53249 RepID=UPI00356629F8